MNENTLIDTIMKEWTDPEPLEGELPAVEPFTEELLPFSFRPMVRDAAERMSVPLDFPAVAAILCLAGAVNRRAVIEPKVNDVDWLVVPNLWGGVIAPPGQLKSPLIDAVCSPVNAIQKEWERAYEAEMEDYAMENKRHELRLRAWEQKFIQHEKDPHKYPPPTHPGDGPPKPVFRRIIVNDATPEKLHEILKENPCGVLVLRDELTGWLAQLDKPGWEDARAFYLSAWNGNSTITVDRIGRGTIHASVCVSMLGGIQPARLRSYLVDAVRDGPGNDGLIQRFQLLVWPDMVPWKNIDRSPDRAAANRVQHAFENLVRMDPENPARFKFSGDGQDLFDGWRDQLEIKLRSGADHPALVAHLAKYRKLMPALALLFELADRSSDSQSFEVSLEHAQQAAAWCDYLESHARRIYSCIVTPRVNSARELARRIKGGGLHAQFTCRDVYRKGWTGLDTSEAARQAVEVLEDANWIRPVPGTKSALYEVNPAVWK